MVYLNRNGVECNSYSEQIYNLPDSDLRQLQNSPNDPECHNQQCIKDSANRTHGSSNKTHSNDNTREDNNETNIENVNMLYQGIGPPVDDKLVLTNSSHYLAMQSLSSSINAGLDGVSNELLLEQEAKGIDQSTTTVIDTYRVEKNEIEDKVCFHYGRYDSQGKLHGHLVENFDSVNHIEAIPANPCVEEFPDQGIENAIEQPGDYAHSSNWYQKDNSAIEYEKISFSVNELLRTQESNQFAPHKTKVENVSKKKSILKTSRGLSFPIKPKPLNGRPVKPKDSNGTRTRCRRRARILFTQVSNNFVEFFNLRNLFQ